MAQPLSIAQPSARAHGTRTPAAALQVVAPAAGQSPLCSRPARDGPGPRAAANPNVAVPCSNRRSGGQTSRALWLAWGGLLLVLLRPSTEAYRYAPSMSTTDAEAQAPGRRRRSQGIPPGGSPSCAKYTLWPFSRVC